MKFAWARREWVLGLNLLTAVLFLTFGNTWLADLSSIPWLALMAGWLFGAILLAAFAVIRHADALARKLGEPYGTLILTLAVTGIEVMMISAMMFTGKGSPTLPRDAMYSVVMIVCNGMVGLSLLVGGLRYREQTYNLRSANSFLAVIVPLAVLVLVIPNFTRATPGPTLSVLQSVFLIFMSLGLYGVFLAIQTSVHREYFVASDDSGPAALPAHDGMESSVLHHVVLLLCYLLPLVILCKQLAVPINHGIAVFNAPLALGGFLVAALILSPESVSAVRAALANQLQRSINLLLGSVLATISLTVPAVLVIGFVTGQPIALGLGELDRTMLVLTLGLSTITFSARRTNVLLGAVHLLLFFAYLMLLFDR